MTFAEILATLSLNALVCERHGLYIAAKDLRAIADALLRERNRTEVAAK